MILWKRHRFELIQNLQIVHGLQVGPHHVRRYFSLQCRRQAFANACHIKMLIDADRFEATEGFEQLNLFFGAPFHFFAVGSYFDGHQTFATKLGRFTKYQKYKLYFFIFSYLVGGGQQQKWQLFWAVGRCWLRVVARVDVWMCWGNFMFAFFVCAL